jgi:1-acyl-sn-glycerol-3-phosphate acyltransferase
MRPSSLFLVVVVKLLVGAYGRWRVAVASERQCIYFANHTSHIDTLALWAALPRRLRQRTRPVAARDYWGGGVKKYIATRSLGAVLIDRARGDPDSDPLEPLRAALDAGDSLILFPEGTRGKDALPQRFRSGLYRLAADYPPVDLVPVYLENLSRALPKGRFLPVPMVCTVRFGTPLARIDGEARDVFLERARHAVIELAAPGTAT